MAVLLFCLPISYDSIDTSLAIVVHVYSSYANTPDVNFSLFLLLSAQSLSSLSYIASASPVFKSRVISDVYD